MTSPIEEYIAYDGVNEAGDPTRFVMTRRAVVHTMAQYALNRGFCYVCTEYAIQVFMHTLKAWYSDRDGERVEFNQ